jgi:dihydroorotase
MNLLLKNIRFCSGAGNDPARPLDLLIRDGRIEAIGEGLEAGEGVEAWAPEDAWVSPGWFDVGVHTGDPGYEHREDLHSVARAAAAGGFTGIAVFPNTQPALHAKSEILYIRNKAAGAACTFYPVGALSLRCEGKEMAELFDMHAAGAIAFSDGSHPVQDAGLLLRSLQYVRAFNGLVLQQPHHVTLAAGGQMHEGVVSTSLGLKGLPALAEEVMVQRDLSLLQYAQGRLHFHLLSTAGSVALIRAAKNAGLPVTCSVAVANLCFTDDELASFDANWKVLPPLRAASDRQALLDGLADGTIDFICSNHTPWDEEAKNLEFPYAEFGIAGIETAFALCRTHLADALSLDALVEKWALGPRRVLGLPIPVLEKGAAAELTVFQPDATWTVGENDLHTKARNLPWIGERLRGRVLSIVNNGKVERF